MVWALLLAYAFHATVIAPGTPLTESAWHYEWFRVTEHFAAGIGCLLDPISVMMLVVITVIAFLINIYSIGYMRHDASAGRFFALLSFFAFAMLGLVMADNLVQMFVFWELVGAASYLLIGFWYDKPEAVAASKKAFIVTRFADAFFLAGIVIVAVTTGHVDFAWLNSPQAAFTLQAGLLGLNVLTIGTVLIFIGGWGKSAMFPLHIWLPDAMEGPTPVSAIIHSATMVVAGVFLTARMFPLFAAADGTLLVVEITGAFTALFAAVIACTQFDIKRILAYSTLSQLGYMMFALGVADTEHPEGYSASMFHVFSHAWFKCLLFQGAGLIIHVVHSNDIREMGGLRAKLKGSWVVMGIACLAIAGFPFLSGFWSKDAILLAAWNGHHYLTFGLGLFVGLLTAFYMFRLFFVVFHGSYRGKQEHYDHAHEDPFMLGPMIVLAIPSLAAGWLANSYFAHHVVVPGSVHAEHAHPMWLPIVAGGAGIIGVAIAWAMYCRKLPDLAAPAAGIRKLVLNKFYVDEVYLWLTHKVIFAWIARPSMKCDDVVVDGLLHGSADGAQSLGAGVRKVQNGRVQRYVAMMVAGVVLIAVIWGISR